MPTVVDGVPGEMTVGGEDQLNLAKAMGEKAHGVYQIFGHLTIGWPSYLIVGLTGGSKYVDDAGRVSNHFWPGQPFSTRMWPGKWADKVLARMLF